MTDSLGNTPPPLNYGDSPLSSTSSSTSSSPSPSVSDNDSVDKVVEKVVSRNRAYTFLETEITNKSSRRHSFSAKELPTSFGVNNVAVRTLIPNQVVKPLALTEDERDAFEHSLRAKPEHCVTGLLETKKGSKLLSEFAFRTGNETNLHFISLIEKYKNSWVNKPTATALSDSNRAIFTIIYNTYISETSPKRLPDISQNTINQLKEVEKNPRWAEEPITRNVLDQAQADVAKKFGEAFLNTPEIQALKKELGVKM